jgi:23S rRNA pseudouridine1911/1915/1917 synthase
MVRWSADDIIYEDEQILVCRKHSGMAVQSARIGQMDLESELRELSERESISESYNGSISRWKGVLVFGKTPQATAWL